MRFQLKVENDSERGQTPEIQREACIFILVGLKAIVHVGVGFATKVGVDAEDICKIILGDKAKPEAEGGVTAGYSLPGMFGIGE